MRHERSCRHAGPDIPDSDEQFGPDCTPRGRHDRTQVHLRGSREAMMHKVAKINVSRISCVWFRIALLNKNRAFHIIRYDKSLTNSVLRFCFRDAMGGSLYYKPRKPGIPHIVSADAKFSAGKTLHQVHQPRPYSQRNSVI
ncbi:hypothetical protein RRG08_025291 [Elysia crispata]|uniref:Uncharacterized protein n=1 Tax=Elysia crispata TaxID=231223 RepID=A0AAE1AG63_9GAST|nr:hypothetical protein RRG08_025291 [Elysia crispata]